MSANQRCKNNRNRFVIAIVVKFERLCCCQICVRLSRSANVLLFENFTSRDVCKAMMRFSSQLNAITMNFRYF